MAMDITKATTPPNLLGMDRRMAYAKRKYHSGWMWTGVTKGLVVSTALCTSFFGKKIFVFY